MTLHTGFTLPNRQIRCHWHVADELVSCFVIFFLQSQRLVVDEPTRASEATHIALLFAIRNEFKFKGLKSLHGSIILWPISGDNNDIKTGRHCVFMMHVHLVFVKKYRRGVFTKKILDDLRQIFVSVCNDFESELIEFDGEDDHVHRLVNYPPKVAVSKLVNSLKGISSLMIRKKKYPSIQKKLWGGALWSPSYFAGSCGGAPIAVIRKYIEQQQTPH